MSGTTPSFSSLIYSASSLLASAVRPDVAVEEIVQIVVRHLGTVAVSVSLRVRQDREVVFAEHRALPAKGRFAFMKQIVVRGTAYGRFHLEADLPRGTAAEWFRTLDTLTHLLALYAESSRVAEDFQRLEKSAQAVRDGLRDEKVLARAPGIVAFQHGLTGAQARTLIANKIGKSGLTTFAFCEQIILDHTFQTQFEPARKVGVAA